MPERMFCQTCKRARDTRPQTKMFKRPYVDLNNVVHRHTTERKKLSCGHWKVLRVMNKTSS